MKIKIRYGISPIAALSGPFYNLGSKYLDGVIAPATSDWDVLYECEPDEEQNFWQRLLDHIR